MNLSEYTEYIIGAFARCGLEGLIDVAKAEKFYAFSRMLVETNKVMNLTAIADEKEIILKHFIDSASICKHVPLKSTLIDVGCGAGFPSIPIAILRDDVSVTSLDSTSKRVDFVSKAAESLCLTNVRAIAARAEDFVAFERESFDVCTSRAVARLNVLSELCVPYVKIGGLFIAMKATNAEEELVEARHGIGRLGCELSLEEDCQFSLEENRVTRTTYLFKKTSSTPKEFPRKFSAISKRPL
mgnify:CR=1 FL=1